MKLLTLASALIIFAVPAYAMDYKVDHAQSSIEFSGTHAGNDFNGEFESWNAQITFDPDNF